MGLTTLSCMVYDIYINKERELVMWYSKLIASLPKTEDSSRWTSEQRVNVNGLEDVIRKYSWGEKNIDGDFFYLSMFTDGSGEFSLTSKMYTRYPGDC